MCRVRGRQAKILQPYLGRSPVRLHDTWIKASWGGDVPDIWALLRSTIRPLPTGVQDLGDDVPRVGTLIVSTDPLPTSAPAAHPASALGVLHTCHAVVGRGHQQPGSVVMVIVGSLWRPDPRGGASGFDRVVIRRSRPGTPSPRTRRSTIRGLPNFWARDSRSGIFTTKHQEPVFPCPHHISHAIFGLFGHPAPLSQLDHGAPPLTLGGVRPIVGIVYHDRISVCLSRLAGSP
jgi:hypothetical protein